MKLFAVNVVTSMVVWASDETQAKKVALQNVRGEEDARVAGDVTPVVRLEDLPGGYEAVHLPWGREDDVTIGEILGAPSHASSS